MKAEHRLGLRASEFPRLLVSWRRHSALAGVDVPTYAWTDEQKKFLAGVAKDLKAHAGQCVVIPGLYQDKSVDALAQAMNARSGIRARRSSTDLYRLRRFRAIRLRA